MAKFKELLISTRLVPAGRRRKCYHSPKHSIKKGELCLEVRDGIGWKGYCSTCATGMLDQAANSLQKIINDVNQLGK